MAIPDYQTTMRPLLGQLKNGQPLALADLYLQLSDYFELTEDERSRRIDSGRQTVIRNRVGWARTYLHKAGLLSIPERAHCQITERGIQALVDCPEILNNQYLKQFPEFVAFQSPKSKTEEQGTGNDGGTNALSVTPESEHDATPEEALQAAHQTLKQALASDLLDTIKQASPQFFEQLVVDLLIAMGYGGSRKEAGQATQYTADGGIDGVINEDPLGLDTIYLQAKRYTNTTVGRPDIQAFVGALEMKRARKGVFITTSRFSNEALEYIAMIEKSVVLIGGKQLAELMIEHDLGVATKETYKIKAIDTDYFLED